MNWMNGYKNYMTTHIHVGIGEYCEEVLVSVIFHQISLAALQKEEENGDDARLKPSSDALLHCPLLRFFAQMNTSRGRSSRAELWRSFKTYGKMPTDNA